MASKPARPALMQVPGPRASKRSALPRHMQQHARRPASPAASVASGTFTTTKVSQPDAMRMISCPTGWEFYGRAFDDLVASISALPTPPPALVDRLLAFCPSTSAVRRAGASRPLYVPAVDKLVSLPPCTCPGPTHSLGCCRRYLDTRSREAVVAVARICLRVHNPGSQLLDRVERWVRALPFLAPHSQNDSFASALVGLALLVAGSTSTSRARTLSQAVAFAIEQLSSDKGVIDSIDALLANQARATVGSRRGMLHGKGSCIGRHANSTPGTRFARWHSRHAAVFTSGHVIWRPAWRRHLLRAQPLLPERGAAMLRRPGRAAGAHGTGVRQAVQAQHVTHVWAKQPEVGGADTAEPEHAACGGAVGMWTPPPRSLSGCARRGLRGYLPPLPVPTVQTIHKLIQRAAPEEVAARYPRYLREAERQLQGGAACIQCAALELMVRIVVVESEHDATAAGKTKAVSLISQLLRDTVSSPQPIMKLAEVLLKGLIDLCAAFPDLLSTAMSTLQNLLLNEVRMPRGSRQTSPCPMRARLLWCTVVLTWCVARTCSPAPYTR